MEQKKYKYQKPEVKLVSLNYDDIIVTSACSSYTCGSDSCSFHVCTNVGCTFNG